ncbi:MAG: MFS transporter [Lachnospiraceae bacterium]
MPPPARKLHRPSHQDRAYWHLFLGYGLFPTLYIICYPRFSMLISDAGYSVAAATLGVSLYSISNVLSRFLFGALIDKIGYRKVYTLCGVLCVAAAVCLMFASSLFMFYAAYVLLAFGFGPTNSCHPVAVQETFGSKYAGGIFGVCMLGYMLICTIISPRISSALVASTGDYTASMRSSPSSPAWPPSPSTPPPHAQAAHPRRGRGRGGLQGLSPSCCCA